jgi:outer membrane receptor protein involved in Fe transport
MLRDWLRGAFRSGLLATGVALLVASPLFGQATTGKIQGRVTDSATGAPIAGAQVTVATTTLGNLTNDQGFYFVNEVPAGLQTVQAQFIGYRSFVIESERILAGQTTTLNFELEQTAVELEAITVEGERNPLVPRDQVASKAIVRGEVVDQLPLDNAAAIVLFSPGVIQTNAGRTIRGGRPNEEAVLIDGVQTRAFGTGLANNVTVPTNSLEQVDVTVGAFSAEFGDAQSGVVNFVTRSGGPRWTGSLEVFTDRIAPDSWRTNFNRLEANLGGPIAGPLTFFLAGTGSSNRSSFNDGSPSRWVADGVDTCSGGAGITAFCEGLDMAGAPAIFPLDRLSTAEGATDVVDVAAPRFIPWDNGRTIQSSLVDVYLFTGNLNYQLPRGGRLTLGYTRNRNQTWGRGTTFVNQFRVDDADGTLNIKNLFSLSGYFVLLQSPDQQLALDLRGSYSSDRFKTGELDRNFWLDSQDPFLGFQVSNLEFLIDENNFQPLGLDVFDPSQEFVDLIRSNGVVKDSFQFYPRRTDLNATQSLAGLDDNLRANPFGWITNFNTRGPGNGGLQVRNEDRWQVRGTIDWQIGRFNRLKLGGEWVDVKLTSTQTPLFDGITIPERAEPTRIGAFLQDRFDVGDLVLEAGIRWDYLDPNVTLPRTPGFNFSVPDSLQKGFIELKPDGSIAPKWDGDNCGGVTTSNPNGTCITNWLETQTKSEFSPRLGASFPVTPTSTFRLSYGRFVQMPAFFTGATVFANSPGTANAVVGFLQSSSNDFGRSEANTNDRFSRDVELPSTRTFEFGYRQLIGTSLVIDVAAYNKKQRDGLTYRKERYEEPLVPGKFRFITVMENADFTESNGIDVKIDHAIGNLFSQSLTYSFIDGRGTGSDEETFVGLLFRATSNLSTITQQPENPPEVLLPLEMSRKHNIGWTGSLAFPTDYMQGSAVGAIFRDFGLFTTLRVASGLPFTRLVQNQFGNIGPPSRSLGQASATTIGALETPWRVQFDLRAQKGFQLGAVNLALFVDWRNPFNLSDKETVFLETGNEFNEAYRDAFLLNALSDSRLDGESGTIDDVDIIAESTDTEYNKFMLLRAEERWGDGDGIFTVEEQNVAFGQRYDAIRGVDNVFRISNQNLRLGLRLAF